MTQRAFFRDQPLLDGEESDQDSGTQTPGHQPSLRSWIQRCPGFNPSGRWVSLFPSIGLVNL